MVSTLKKTNRYRWILGLTAAGMTVVFLSGSGGLREQLTSFAAMEDEVDWTLANGKIVEEADVDWTLAHNENVHEEKVDWTLAKNDSQDTNDIEPDWTLARNDSDDQEETDWTLA